MYVLEIGSTLFYYKLVQTLLQIVAALLLQTGVSVVTDCGSYYRLGELLLQNRATLTNWAKMSCKLGQVLPIIVIAKILGITNCMFHLY